MARVTEIWTALGLASLAAFVLGAGGCSSAPTVAAEQMLVEDPPVSGAPYRGTTHFENPEGSAKRTSIVTRLPALVGRFIEHGLHSQTSDRSHILAHDDAVAALATAAGANSVTWIGHMTVLLRVDGRTILTDPWWSSYERPGPGLGPRAYAASALSLDELPPIDIVLVSHSHYDHLDLDAVAHLPRREAITAVVPLGLGHFFRERGYGRVVELDWERSVEVAGIKLTAL